MNNICDSFSAKILTFSDKPIVTIFEGLRIMLMVEFEDKKEERNKWSNLLCIRIRKKIEYKTTHIARHSISFVLDNICMSASVQGEFSQWIWLKRRSAIVDNFNSAAYHVDMLFSRYWSLCMNRTQRQQI